MALLLNPVSGSFRQEKDFEHECEKLKAKVSDLEEQLRKERIRTAGVDAGVRELRTVLHPLYQALQHIYGEFDGMSIDGAVPAKHSVVWDSWKQKLGGLPAKAIDALLLHGAMNQTQLRIFLGCATGSVTNVVVALNKAGLINKNGRQISLKEL